MEIPFGVLWLPVLPAPAVGTLCSSLCPHPSFLLCLPSVFAIMKILHSLLPTRAWVERKFVWDPLLLETKQFSFPTLRVRVFSYLSFVGLQCFLPSSVLWSWRALSGLSCTEAQLFSFEDLGDMLLASGVTVRMAVSFRNNIIGGY